MLIQTSVCGYQIVSRTGKKDFNFVRVCYPVDVPGAVGRFFLTSLLDVGDFGSDGVKVGSPLVVSVDSSLRVLSVSPADKYLSSFGRKGEIDDG